MTADESQEKNKLAVIWSARDREVALNMVFMYTKNSKLRGWWDQVRLIIWGPSAELLAQDEGLQTELAVMREAGVELQACKSCSDRYGVSEKLAELGVDVIYMGVPLTEYLKGDWAVLTF
ncbi:MAG: DsrE family protein [Dehalococcoidales bacterium]|nr:DsrE family protein [Dehalococcoidales bacterium]